jgi:hypothetical protein
MKKLKKIMGWQNDTKKLKSRDQAGVTRLRTGYSRATHRNTIEGTPDPDILWQCKETEEERRKKYGRKEKKEQKCW